MKRCRPKFIFLTFTCFVFLWCGMVLPYHVTSYGFHFSEFCENVILIIHQTFNCYTFIVSATSSATANLLQKIKIVSLSWNVVPKTKSNMQNLMVMFTVFCFWPEITHFGQVWSNKSKFFSLNWNFIPVQTQICQNSMVMLTFFVFEQRFHSIFWKLFSFKRKSKF